MGKCMQTLPNSALKDSSLNRMWPSTNKVMPFKTYFRRKQTAFSLDKTAFSSMKRGVLKTSRNSHTGINREVL